MLVMLSALCTTSWAQVYYKNSEYQWKGNEILQGKFRGRAVSPTEVTSNYVPLEPRMEVWNDMNPKEIDRRRWTLHTDIAHLPHYESTNMLETALYNMALEESVLAIEPDSTFRTGIAWGGVWTRDVSYSIILSLSQLHPEVCMKSLRAKVNSRNRIIQDTGTGGAWPCSTDRVIWAVAAWEVYKTTGDRQWLDYIYPIIRNTLQDDMLVAYDRQNQLMRGETSYMDWREQEYPQWMEPADIYTSEATVNNAVHYMALCVMTEICKAKQLEREAEMWRRQADNIREGINRHLWLPQRGYYAIYLYGRRHLVLSEQCDAMGSALTILSGIADGERARQISEHQVCEPFGTPCIYPNLKDQYPYHNDATWPFVQGYWMKACARVGNEAALMHSIGALYRGAALWLSNEENYEITTGDYQQTKLNSPRQLWSVAAQSAIVTSVYFGIDTQSDRLVFRPFVPKALKGTRRLTNYRYRQALLDIRMTGYGNRIKTFLLDGQEAQPEVAATLTGRHEIEIVLADNTPEKMTMTLAANAYLPLTPQTEVSSGGVMTWKPTEGSVAYEIIRDGQVVGKQTETSLTLTQPGAYSVRGVDASGMPGYISAPQDFSPAQTLYQAEDYGIATGSYLELTRTKNISVVIPIEVSQEGDYSIDWRYSNGAGPVNTNNRCAIRLMRIGRAVYPVVLPQRGEGRWVDWGFTNKQTVHLTAGRHVVSLDFTDRTENMHGEQNEARIDYLRIIKL